MAAFVAVLLAVALLIAAATAYILWQSRIETYRRADAASEILVRAIAKDLERSIDARDVALRWAINGLSTPGFAEASDAVRRQMLFASDLNAQILGGILIVDDTGRAMFESGAPVPRVANVSDQPYFKMLRDHPELGLVISRPFTFIAADGPSIALARAITGADGYFAGVAVAMIKLSFLHELIHTAAGPDDTITLVAEDGTLLAREPWDDQLVGCDLSVFSTWDRFHAVPDVGFDLVSGITHVYRHYRVARVGNFPLLLLEATAISAIFAGWWQEALAIGTVTAATIALLLGLARSLRLELARRRRAEMITRESEAQFRMLAENVSDIILRLDLEGSRRYISPSVEEVLGFTAAEMMQAGRWDDFIHVDDRPVVCRALDAMRAGKEHVTVLYRSPTRSGTEAWLEARLRLVRDADTGDPREIIALARDVTSRHASEQELRRLASTDSLTGLVNRRRFDEALDGEWRRAMRAEEHVALLMLDADYFKFYNDRYGHPAGDEVLRIIARCIRSHVGRPGDLAARYGGEEFAVLLPATDRDGALGIAEGIRVAIRDCAVPHDGSPFRQVTVSIGVACWQVKEDGDPRLLIQHADSALYEAKRSGRDRVVVAEMAVTVPAQ